MASSAKLKRTKSRIERPQKPKRSVGVPGSLPACSCLMQLSDASRRQDAEAKAAAAKKRQAEVAACQAPAVFQCVSCCADQGDGQRATGLSAGHQSSAGCRRCQSKQRGAESGGGLSRLGSCRLGKLGRLGRRRHNSCHVRCCGYGECWRRCRASSSSVTASGVA